MHFAARYFVAIIAGMGVAIVYGVRVNLSVAIIRMVNYTAIQASEENKNGTSGEKDVEDGPFDWPPPLQGMILSSYFWGYIIGQYPGGRMAEAFGAKLVLMGGVICNAILCALTPLAAKCHAYVLIATRVLIGLTGGVLFPSTHVFIAGWSPPAERGLISSVCYSGTTLGPMLSTLISGWTAAGLGWEAIFYTQGIASFVWVVAWYFLVADGPKKQKYFISDREREYIINAQEEYHQADQASSSADASKAPEKRKMPWGQMLRSKPFYAVIICNITATWGWYMILIDLPLFMKTALHFKISDNATLSALPFLLMWAFSMAVGRTLDHFIHSKKITITVSRKIGNGIATLGPGLCIAGICFLGTSTTTTVVFMCLAVMFSGALFSGTAINHVDIAPKLVGTIMGICNTFGTLPGIIVPIFVGEMIKEDSSLARWRIIFLTTIVILSIQLIIFTWLGSGKEQPWAIREDKG